MPQAILAAGTAAANWAAGAAANGALAAGFSVSASVKIATVAATIAYSAVGAAASAIVSVGLAAYAQSQLPDVETQKQTRKQTRPLRYRAIGGPSRMSGPFMLRESKGNKLALVIACCDDRLSPDGIEIYLNDDKVTLSGGFVQGMAGERYGSGDLVRLEYRLGEPTETHYGFLTTDFGAYWPTSARGDGIASIGMLAVHRSTESFPRHFPNAEPVPSMVGAPLCYDWRDPAQDRSDPNTWAVSENPIVWLVHVEWSRHGRSWDRCIEPRLAELTEEADYCDETVGAETRYRVAGNYPINLTPDAVRANLLAAMDGWMSVNGKGQLVVLAGRYTEPTFTLPAEHITGYSWKAFQVAEEAVNELVVSYVSSAHNYSEIEAGTFSKDVPHPLGRSESLALPWVPSAGQAMRLAPRKMSRLDAPRRGQVRSTIYGLNGLGQRYIRIQNPELSTMADVVVEVMNVEIDFANAEVVFDIIQADTEIDVPGTAPEVPATPDRPPTEPGYQDPAEPPIRKIDGPDFPIEASISQIDVTAFTASLRAGPVAIPAATLTGLADATEYALFYREDEGVSAIPKADSDPYFVTGSRVFLGWQTTPDGGGAYPDPPIRPPGNGGTGDVPAYIE